MRLGGGPFWGLIGAALLLIGAGLIARQSERAAAAPFEAEVGVDIGVVGARQESTTTVRLRNASGRPAQILGSFGHCGPGGCIDTVGLPLLIAPTASVEVALAVRAPERPGRFRLTIPLLTDHLDQRQVLAAVTGEVRGEAHPNGD